MNAWSRYKGWSSKGKDGFRWGSCCRVVARRESFFFWLSHWEADDRTYEKPPAVFAQFAAYAPQALKRHRLTQLPANDDVSGGGCQAQHGLGRRGKAIDSTRRFIENSERLVYPC